jgi:hypothetical protein
MIWFDSKELEKQLTDGTVDDKSGYHYLIGITLLFTIGGFGGIDYENYWLKSIYIAADVVLTIVTLRTTYNINTTGNNKEYLKRYVALSFVVSIRLLVYLVLVMAVGAFVTLALEQNGPLNKDLKNIANLCLDFGAMVVFYFMLTASFWRVNAATLVRFSDPASHGKD